MIEGVRRIQRPLQAAPGWVVAMGRLSRYMMNDYGDRTRWPDRVSVRRLCLVQSMYGLCIMGCTIMIAADAQKYFTLRVRGGLITDGMYRFVRHPNYLGEVVVYIS